METLAAIFVVIVILGFLVAVLLSSSDAASTPLDLREPHILELIADLEDADINNDLAFHQLVNCALELSVVSEQQIARQFGMAKPSVERWKNGRTAPHPVMRRPVYKYLIREAKQKLELGDFDE